MTRLTLPAELTIYTVAELHPHWLSWLHEASTEANPATPQDAASEVDGSAVDQIDAAGLQLLVALRHALQQRHRPWQLVGASQPLRAACAALGLSALLASSTGAGANA